MASRRSSGSGVGDGRPSLSRYKRQVSEKGWDSSHGKMSSPSILIVGEPGKRSARACSSDSTSTDWTSASTPTSARLRSRSASVSGWDGQPSHQSSSTRMDLHALDHRVLGGPVLGPGLRALDRVDRLHARADLAEDGVLAVEPGSRVGRDDEELAAVRVRPAVGHRQRAAHDLVVVDLVLELVARAAGAGSLRAAALDHEVLDDAVEDQPVVVAVLRQLHEVLDGLRGIFLEQLELDRPVVGVHGRLAHRLLVTSTRSSVPRTRFPFTLSTTSPARCSGTSTNEKRSSTRTLRTSSFSRCEWSTTAPTTSAGSMPCVRPAPTTSFT